MSILNEQTVGGVKYLLIDDLYPLHSGDTGDVAISTTGDIFSCIGGAEWAVHIRQNVSGELYSYGNSESLNPTVGTWTNMNNLTWTSTNLDGFTLSGASNLLLSSPHIGKFLVVGSHTFEAENNRWIEVDASAVRNNVVPYRFNGGSAGTNNTLETCSFITPAIYEMDSADSDYNNMAYRLTDEEGTQARVNRKHHSLTSEMIDRPIIFNEGWESGDFNTNEWTVVNNATNQWHIGTATSNSGTQSAYISDDSGTSNTYSNTGAIAYSHFYKDITFPINLASNPELRFSWKGVGEVGGDYGKVFLAPSGTTVTADVAISESYKVGLSEYSNQATYADAIVDLGTPLELAGETKRLIFSWRNNLLLGSNPPWSVDDVRLHYYVGNIDTSQVFLDSDFETGSISGDGWTVVNHTTNTWTVGTAESTGSGTQAAYITNDGGTSASYDVDVANVSHFYRDIVFPSSASITMTFDWKSWAENSTNATNWDYGTVVIADTGTTPTAGTEVSTTQASAGGNGRIGASTNLGKFNLGYGGADSNWRNESINMTSYAGLTKRLIFTWKNDGSVGNNPPFVVDNIKIIYV